MYTVELVTAFRVAMEDAGRAFGPERFQAVVDGVDVDTMIQARRIFARPSTQQPQSS